MLNLNINFNDYSDKKELYTYLSHNLNFPTYFSYNLDSLYDILCDIDFEVTITIYNKEKFEDVYLTLKDSTIENSNIKLITK